MINFKLLQKLFLFMALGFSLCTLQACGGDEDLDDETTMNPANDYGKIKGNSLVATGGYRDVKPLRATILSSINTEYQGAYSSMGVEFTPSQPNFNSSETRRVESYSGITNGHFETDLSAGGEGLLEPGTTYYYRAYANMGGSRYNGETRSFVTPDLQLSEGEFVDLGLSVKWATYNMGADAPEVAGTLLKQCCAFENFDGESDYVPDDVFGDNWLGNSDYDVATRTLGSGYRIPTEKEWRELEDAAFWKVGVYNGVKGFYISDRADGTAVIFLPYVKKSDEHDITVYLSAPNDMIRNLKEARRCNEQYETDLMNTRSMKEANRISEKYRSDMIELKKKLGAGEVLTESTYTYCDYGLILNPLTHIHFYYTVFDNTGNTGGYQIFFDDPSFLGRFTWTHPETGKEYNFYEENGVNGGGVLYVRPVSNR